MKLTSNPDKEMLLLKVAVVSVMFGTILIARRINILEEELKELRDSGSGRSHRFNGTDEAGRSGATKDSPKLIRRDGTVTETQAPLAKDD